MSKGTRALALSAPQAISWTGSAPTGAKLDRVFIGSDPDGLGGIQVATVTVASAPTRTLLDKLFALRKGNRAITLLLAATDGVTTWLYGPVNRAGFRSVLEVRMEPDEPEVFTGDA
ncbi:hypothetical protein AB2L57_17330 [Microbacterium sp. HA-8]|uniref:hypothetical protein n=1 Tax=Microbacterium sp. HA-8 TaxID=3234200 RepID=UPI0038F68C5A